MTGNSRVREIAPSGLIDPCDDAIKPRRAEIASLALRALESVNISRTSDLPKSRSWPGYVRVVSSFHARRIYIELLSLWPMSSWRASELISDMIDCVIMQKVL